MTDSRTARVTIGSRTPNAPGTPKQTRFGDSDTKTYEKVTLNESGDRQRPRPVSVGPASTSTLPQRSETSPNRPLPTGAVSPFSLNKKNSSGSQPSSPPPQTPESQISSTSNPEPSPTTPRIPKGAVPLFTPLPGAKSLSFKKKSTVPVENDSLASPTRQPPTNGPSQEDSFAHTRSLPNFHAVAVDPSSPYKQEHRATVDMSSRKPSSFNLAASDPPRSYQQQPQPQPQAHPSPGRSQASSELPAFRRPALTEPGGFKKPDPAMTTKSNRPPASSPPPSPLSASSSASLPSYPNESQRLPLLPPPPVKSPLSLSTSSIAYSATIVEGDEPGDEHTPMSSPHPAEPEPILLPPPPPPINMALLSPFSEGPENEESVDSFPVMSSLPSPLTASGSHLHSSPPPPRFTALPSTASSPSVLSLPQTNPRPSVSTSSRPPVASPPAVPPPKSPIEKMNVAGHIISNSSSTTSSDGGGSSRSSGGFGVRTVGRIATGSEIDDSIEGSDNLDPGQLTPTLTTTTTSTSTTSIASASASATTSPSSSLQQKRMSLLKSPSAPTISVGKLKQTPLKVEAGLVLFSKNFQIAMKGGTLHKILEQITQGLATEQDIIDTFLLTYRSFITPLELLEQMFVRYSLKPEDVPPQQEFTKLQKVVHLRVTNFVKRWVSDHWHDFEKDEKLQNRLLALVEEIYYRGSAEQKHFGDNIKQIVIEKRQNDLVNDHAKQFSSKPPPSFVPKTDKFEEFHPEEFGRQLCLYQQNLFRAIHPKELLSQSWNKKKENSPNILAMIKFFNVLSAFVGTQIVQQTQFKDRVNCIKFFGRLAIDCRNNNNFDAVRSILAGLAAQSVYRLRKSWLKVKADKKFYDEIAILEELVAPKRSYAALRSNIANAAPPCLPCLGVYLQDLTFLEDGNPDYLVVEDGRTDIINVDKMNKVALVIKSVILYQQQVYNFTKVDLIYDYLGKLPVLSEDEQFRLSKEVESKEEADAADKKEAKETKKTAKKN